MDSWIMLSAAAARSTRVLPGVRSMIPSHTFFVIFISLSLFSMITALISSCSSAGLMGVSVLPLMHCSAVSVSSRVAPLT